MPDLLSDMETVTIELTEAELEAVDDIAFRDHRENREAAVRDLLQEWLQEQ
jgi:metal-responsive CopG/Arc/MetJ family transcriptional regulator